MILLAPEQKIITVENVFMFSIVKTYEFLNERKPTGYELRAYHSGYTDDNGNGDYVSVKRYGLNDKDKAEQDYNKIATSFCGNSPIIDLRD